MDEGRATPFSHDGQLMHPAHSCIQEAADLTLRMSTGPTGSIIRRLDAATALGSEPPRHVYLLSLLPRQTIFRSPARGCLRVRLTSLSVRLLLLVFRWSVSFLMRPCRGRSAAEGAGKSKLCCLREDLYVASSAGTASQPMPCGDQACGRDSPAVIAPRSPMSPSKPDVDALPLSLSPSSLSAAATSGKPSSSSPESNSGASSSSATSRRVSCARSERMITCAQACAAQC